MKILTVNGPYATVELHPLDLLIFHNALNEVCHGIDIPELHSRIGADEQEIKALLQAVEALYDKIDTSSL